MGDDMMNVRWTTNVLSGIGWGLANILSLDLEGGYLFSGYGGGLPNFSCIWTGLAILSLGLEGGTYFVIL